MVQAVLDGIEWHARHVEGPADRDGVVSGVVGAQAVASMIAASGQQRACD